MASQHSPAPSPPRVAAVIVAAGRGTRSGLGGLKQLHPLGGRPLLEWSIAAFAAHPAVERVILVHTPGEQAAFAPVLARWPDVVAVAGGDTRRASVAAGLGLVPDDATAVLIHDAARPGLDAGVVDRLIDALGDADGAVPVLPIADTIIARAGDATAGAVIDRDQMVRVQTPQAFRRRAIVDAHAGWTGDEPTDDAQMVRIAGGTVALVKGDTRLHKLTEAQDAAVLAALLVPAGARRTVVGSGYDVHRLVPGKPLWLGGVEIAHSHGLSGHSDADVALHALTDAILGAIGDGDIGSHFPPSDPQWRGAASWRFLEFAGQRVAERGGRIDHLDLTIVCEAPRVGPHRDAIRERIAEILGIDPDWVSVKATTTERLGFTGREEGIAATAVATISLEYRA